MTGEQQKTDREWVCEQITQYSQQYEYYQAYAQKLKEVLEKAARHVAPLAIVQARPKALPSFAEKAWRKRSKYRDPLNRMTDLAGGRVITQTQADVNAICEFIKAHFVIDWENSLDVSQRLKPTEFGYRSVHYIVQFKPGVFPSKEVDVEIPETLFPALDRPMKAEIQVRTVLEHAWAGFAHDKAYKGAFAIPDKWERQLAGLAAMLEEADEAFTRVQRGLETYAANYGAYMSKEDMRADIEMWESVLSCQPGNVEVAHRVGKLAMTLGDWKKALDVLSRYADSEYQPLLRDLGVTMCKVHRGKPRSSRYRKGQKYLEAASAPPCQDADALASLAGTWKVLDEEKAHELYRQAFEVDPSDPYAVSNYLVYEVVYRDDASLVALMEPIVARALQRCREQADVSMNLPWAFYNMGIFHLLLRHPYNSLAAYARAIELSTDDWMIETSLRLLDRLEAVGDKPVGYEWARLLLQLGRLKFPTPELKSQLIKLALKGREPLREPVVIVSGGHDASVAGQLQKYREFLLQGFEYFDGTVICGGTTAGISGLVGDVQAAYPETLRTIGYVPRLVPAGTRIDERYGELRRTEGLDFSPLEALQYWIDLLAAGIQPAQVKLLGINGGDIAAVEYRMALAFGARVAVIAGSGRAATELLADRDWAACKCLLRLPADRMAVKAFIGSGNSRLRPEVRENIARAIHERYREAQSISQRVKEDPALAEWDKLAQDLQESNKQQADDIEQKLRAVHYVMCKVEGRAPALAKFSPEQVELMAEMEHGRWVAERLQQGWTLGAKRDMAAKTHPSLVPWSQLPETEKEKNRETVRGIPDFLARVGFEVSPVRR